MENNFFKRASDAEGARGSESRESRGGFRDRDDRGQRGSDRGDRGGFRKEGGFRGKDDRGGFRKEGGFRGKDDRGGFRKEGGDRGGFRKEGGFRGKDDRKFGDKPRFGGDKPRFKKDDRGGKFRKDNGTRANGPSKNPMHDQPREDKLIEGMIYGIHPIREAFEAGKTLEKIYTVKGGNESLQAIIEMAEERGVVVQYVPTPKLDYLSRQSNHQGVVATIAQIDYADINEVLSQQPKLLMVLDGVTDVRNFGAIARTCECAGVDAIIISAKNSAPINGEAMKSSAGALSTVPICKVGSLRNALKQIQLADIQLVAASEKADTTIYELDYTKPTAIIMGSEDKGISTDILKLCDAMGRIPMQGSIGSLNVSAAAAVLLYQYVRQQQG